MCHSVTERYLSLGSTLPSASRAKGDLLEPDEEAPVGAEAEGGGILSWEAREFASSSVAQRWTYISCRLAEHNFSARPMTKKKKKKVVEHQTMPEPGMLIAETDVG